MSPYRQDAKDREKKTEGEKKKDRWGENKTEGEKLREGEKIRDRGKKKGGKLCRRRVVFKSCLSYFEPLKVWL